LSNTGEDHAFFSCPDVILTCHLRFGNFVLVRMSQHPPVHHAQWMMVCGQKTKNSVVFRSQSYSISMYYPSTSIYLHRLDENFIIALFMDEKRASWFSHERWWFTSDNQLKSVQSLMTSWDVHDTLTIYNNLCALLQLTNLVHIPLTWKQLESWACIKSKTLWDKIWIHQMGRKRYLITVIYSRAKMVKWASSSLV
jgi:hypothetical protein